MAVRMLVISSFTYGCLMIQSAVISQSTILKQVVVNHVRGSSIKDVCTKSRMIDPFPILRKMSALLNPHPPFHVDTL